MSLTQWMTTVGMPGSCGIACFDALVATCTGTRDAGYRQETVEIAQQQLDDRKLVRLLNLYDKRYAIHDEYFSTRRQEACDKLHDQRFANSQLAVRFARQSGHSRFANPELHDVVPEPAPTQTGDASSAKRSAQPAPAGGVPANVLAPAGVTIGMGVDEADTVLTASGYERLLPCQYRIEVGRGRITIVLGAGTPGKEWVVENGAGHWESQQCVGPVKTILYEEWDIPVEGSPFEIISRMNEQFGANPECSHLDTVWAECNWKSVPNSPVTQSAALQFDRPRLHLSLVAVEDLEERRTSDMADETMPTDIPSPAASMPARTIADDVDLLAGGITADGLVICANEEILPLSAQMAEKILVGNEPAAKDLRLLLAHLGMDVDIVQQRVGD